ncbi:YigZ family protein [Pseudobacteroides cellulosolvens]|uniref:YigZ family protein n=1 Tax=Pseudobacteroides cellulosolvens TaxID=35825 RepID=UPI0005614FA5|nr:YigZ family protein [Pseudobacteroides cellulosolvens]
MIKEYKTVLNEAVAQTEEKKSRFIASVKHVKCEEEALEFVSRLKTQYWDATHNVYAYHIVGDSVIQRFSDDGEPSGTAGIPVLEVIKKTGIQDVVVVVTRYFGGTLLGAAGLIRAYGKCAAAGIEAANIVKRLLCQEIIVIVEYTIFGKVQNKLEVDEYIIKEINYEQDVQLTVYIPVESTEVFIKNLTELTNATAIIEAKGEVYITVDQNGKIINT